MKYFYFKSIITSIFLFFMISGIVVICSSFNYFLNHILHKKVLIGSFVCTTILALFLLPLFKYIEENK